MEHPSISDEQIRDILINYVSSATYEMCESIRAYISLLLLWNKTVSLTSITDVREIVKFHFGESMFAAARFGIEDGRLADVGSGAGFPGIPLRLISPKLDLTLIESNAKKAAFLAEVSRKLSLDIEVFKGRMEDFVGSSDRRFDFVTTRAVGHIDEFLRWTSLHLRKDGKAVLWLGESDLNHVAANPSWIWLPSERIPGSTNRTILCGSSANAQAE